VVEFDRKKCERVFAPACQTKKRQFTKRRAKLQLAQLKARVGDTTGRLGIYKCNFCGWWHIGHTDRRSTRRVSR